MLRRRLLFAINITHLRHPLTFDSNNSPTSFAVAPFANACLFNQTGCPTTTTQTTECRFQIGIEVKPGRIVVLSNTLLVHHKLVVVDELRILAFLKEKG